MRKNVSTVATAFLARRACGGNTLHTDGTTIWSYDMPIAQWVGFGAVEIIARDKGPTATTRSHIAGMARALDFAKEVQALTNREPHTFRDRAGQSGYLTRSRALPR